VGPRQHRPAAFHNVHEPFAKEGGFTSTDGQRGFIRIDEVNEVQELADPPVVLDLPGGLRAHDAIAVAPFRGKEHVPIVPAPIPAGDTLPEGVQFDDIP
jgi:hypothetical protein